MVHKVLISLYILFSFCFDEHQDHMNLQIKHHNFISKWYGRSVDHIEITASLLLKISVFIIDYYQYQCDVCNKVIDDRKTVSGWLHKRWTDQLVSLWPNISIYITSVQLLMPMSDCKFKGYQNMVQQLSKFCRGSWKSERAKCRDTEGSSHQPIWSLKNTASARQ